jgi:hypothetical protein
MGRHSVPVTRFRRDRLEDRAVVREGAVAGSGSGWSVRRGGSGLAAIRVRVHTGALVID